MVRREPPRSILSELFGIPREKFLDTYFPHRPLVRHGRADRFGAVSQAPALKTPEAMLAAAGGDVILGYQGRIGSPDQAQAVFAKLSALGMFERGWSLNLDFLDRSIPELGVWLRSLRAELGLKEDQLFCSGIISPAGVGLPKHFDSIEVITVQLYGRKKWWWAEATEIPYPGVSVMPGVKTNYRDGNDHPAYYPKNLATEMPANARVTVLKAGSAMFMPRGYWHQTHAETVSLSLNIGLKTSTPIELLTGALQSELDKLAQWRQPLPVATDGQKTRARAQLAALLQDLAAQLGSYEDKALRWATSPGPARPSRPGPKP